MITAAAWPANIERLRPLPDLEAIAERMLSPRARQTLRGLPLAEQYEAFFICWTKKEADIKAIGAARIEGRRARGVCARWQGRAS